MPGSSGGVVIFAGAGYTPVADAPFYSSSWTSLGITSMCLALQMQNAQITSCLR